MILIIIPPKRQTFGSHFVFPNFIIIEFMLDTNDEIGKGFREATEELDRLLYINIKIV
jgi:hypothetical protein